MDTNAIAFLALCLATAWKGLTTMFAWLVADPLLLAGAAAAGLLLARFGKLAGWFTSRR